MQGIKDGTKSLKQALNLQGRGHLLYSGVVDQSYAMCLGVRFPWEDLTVGDITSILTHILTASRT
jgi:hypothetical protein